MDGPLEHSDSDSGESWTLLEPNSTLTEETLELVDRPIKIEKEKAEIHDRDEDTDGISIISDSDPDSAGPCQMHFETLYEEDQETKTPCCPMNLSFPEHDDHSIRDDDFLGMDTGKHKTYVHRRNKRLSTVLNIIVLGSVITAAGVAIGHMWGAKTDCLMNSTPNINNILSSLYKLQEENAYLRSKLKELTAYQNFQFKGSRNNRCAKVFEESLSNDKNYKPTRCVDSNAGFSIKVQNPNNKWNEPAIEKEFKGNIDKLKNIYFENKHWLDDEISFRLHQEGESLKRMRHVRQANKYDKNNEEKDLKVNLENNENIKKLNEQNESTIRYEPPKIISYADSLNVVNDTAKKENQFKVKTNTSDYPRTKKIKKEKIIESSYENPLSEEEFKDFKDTRYNGPKYKRERKKHDRQKTYKKQKRRNKYEQWEMKEGLMKDYDELSLTSQDKNDHSQEKIQTFDKKSGSNHCYKDIETKFDNKKTQIHLDNREGKKDSRSHREMKRLEEELFGEEQNSAGWYFRRMQRREQCRAKGTNNTNQKFSKRNMNYKMKH